MLFVPFTENRDVTVLNEPTLSGHTLQLTTKAIHLGIILDKWLTAEKCDEYGLQDFLDLWTFSKTWVLKPRVLHWIYTMVITHVLAYNLTVWWLRIRNNVRRTEFSKLQRLPWLDKTGVMEINPAAALTLVTPKNLGIWEHKPSLHMWSNRMLLRYAYHKPFMVKFPEKCKWQNGFN